MIEILFSNLRIEYHTANFKFIETKTLLHHHYDLQELKKEKVN